jgi:hypothetical protein
MMKTLHNNFILKLNICNHPEGDLTDNYVVLLQNMTKQDIK